MIGRNHAPAMIITVQTSAGTGLVPCTSHQSRSAETEPPRHAAASSNSNSSRSSGVDGASATGSPAGVSIPRLRRWQAFARHVFEQ